MLNFKFLALFTVHLLIFSNYRLLKLYIRLGLQITKINRVLEYDQSNYMKKYIMLNTKLRTKAKTEFEQKKLN